MITFTIFNLLQPALCLILRWKGELLHSLINSYFHVLFYHTKCVGQLFGRMFLECLASPHLLYILCWMKSLQGMSECFWSDEQVQLAEDWTNIKTRICIEAWLWSHYIKCLWVVATCLYSSDNAVSDTFSFVLVLVLLQKLLSMPKGFFLWSMLWF